MKLGFLKAALVSSALILASGTAYAADYSGTWVRDTPAGNAAGYPNYWLTRSPAGGGFGPNGPYVMDVVQTGGSIRVTDPTHPQRNYALDGKPHTMRADTMIAQSTSTAAMKGDALMLVTVAPYGGMPGNVKTTETQTWSLSPDAKVLTISMVRQSSARRQVFAEVYRRK